MSRTASKPPRRWGRLGRRLLQPAFWRHGRSEIVWDPVRIIEAARSVAFPVYGLAAIGVTLVSWRMHGASRSLCPVSR
jgi:hypothetical protein